MHRLEKAHQHGQRRTKLVRNVCDEIASHRLDSLHLGDIAAQQELLRLAVRDELQRQDHALRGGSAHCGQAVVVGRSEIVDECRLAHQVRDRPPGVGARVEIQHGGGVVVAPLDAVVRVEHHHAVGQRLRRAPEARQRVGEHFLALRRLALEAVQRR